MHNKNLEWSTIEDNHRGYWRSLENLGRLIQYWHTDFVPLKQLAFDCIKACSDLLFPRPDPSINLPVSMEAFYPSMAKALADHLLVSFSYRFLCDNLEGKTLGKYTGVLYNCMNQTIRGDRENLKKSTQQSFNRWRNKSADIYGLSGQELQPPNWLFSLTLATSQMAFDPLSLFIKQDGGSFSFHQLEYKGRSSKGLLYDLNNFLTRSKFAPLLFKAAEDKIIPTSPFSDLPGYCPSMLELHTIVSHIDSAQAKATIIADTENGPEIIASNNVAYRQRDILSTPFTVLTKDIDGYLNTHLLPPQTYTAKGNWGAHDITIDPDIQFIFNSYFLERSYHGYAISIILDCLNWHIYYKTLSPKNAEGLLILLSALLRIRAPMAHAAFIRAYDSILSNELSRVGSIKWIQTVLSWIDTYITRLNTEGLPILEELFLWNVFMRCPPDCLLDMIKYSYFSSDDQFCREDFILYRLRQPIPPLANSLRLHGEQSEKTDIPTDGDDADNRPNEELPDFSHIAELEDFLLFHAYQSSLGYYCSEIADNKSGKLACTMERGCGGTIFD